MLKIPTASGLTAVAPITCPKTSASAARTFAIASTPGVFAAAFPGAIGSGENVCCAVIA